MKPKSIGYMNMRKEQRSFSGDELYFDEKAQCYLVNMKVLTMEKRQWLEDFYKEKEELINAKCESEKSNA